VKAIDIKQQPIDYNWDLQTLMFGFEGGRVCAVHLAGEAAGEKLYFTKWGWEQMADFICMNVGHRKSFEFQGASDRGIVMKGPNGEEVESRHKGSQLAALNFNWFVSNYAPKRRVKLRTILTKNQRGQVERVVRAVVTPSYTAFDELDYLNLMLDSERSLGTQPVIKFRQGDSGMYLRILDGEHPETFELGTIFKTRNFWNSPVTKARVGHGYGGIKGICTNGMVSHHTESELKLYHKGDADEIRRSLVNHSEEARAIRNGLLEDYSHAMDTEIDNASAWMESVMKSFRQTETSIDSVRRGMRHETSNPVGTLAGVYDGITLIAQDKVDLFEQQKLEVLASKILEKGLNTAKNSPGGVIRAPRRKKEKANA
jgi:hypothetical protein